MYYDMEQRFSPDFPPFMFVFILWAMNPIIGVQVVSLLDNGNLHIKHPDHHILLSLDVL